MPTILIVDDIIVNRILLTEIIGKLGYDFIEANNGKEAISILSDNSINLVLMDIEMPIMNGLEATKYIRQQLDKPLKDIPIIGLTAYNPNDFFDSFKDAGFNELICKPYLVEKVTNAINKFV